VSAPLLLALVLAAPAGQAPRPPPGGPAAPGQRVELTVRFPPWQFTGTFELAGAGLADRGAARDRGSLAGAEPVERVLAGERGSLTLSLRAGLRASSFPPVLGRWQVVGGTGAYQGASGGGTFTATDLGTGQGSLLELQVLVGRLLVPRRPEAWTPPARQAPAAVRPPGPAPER